MDKHKPQFTVRRTEEFVQKCNELSKAYGRLTELINAVDWSLQTRPHYYDHLAGEFYLLKSGALSNPAFPKLKILYKILEAESTVVMLEIDDD